MPTICWVPLQTPPVLQGNVCGAFLFDSAHSFDVHSIPFLVDLHECAQRNNSLSSKRPREQLLFHLLMHSLVDSCMSLEWESNPQPWHMGTML